MHLNFFRANMVIENTYHRNHKLQKSILRSFLAAATEMKIIYCMGVLHALLFFLLYIEPFAKLGKEVPRN